MRVCETGQSNQGAGIARISDLPTVTLITRYTVHIEYPVLTFSIHHGCVAPNHLNCRFDFRICDLWRLQGAEEFLYFRHLIHAGDDSGDGIRSQSKLNSRLRQGPLAGKDQKFKIMLDLDQRFGFLDGKLSTGMLLNRIS